MARKTSACLVLAALLASFEADQTDDWPVCDNRAYRDDETEPGGLKLLGVKESPLGYFPQTPGALTHEHFFQQLREVLSDDCPRVMVQVGLQPAPGVLRNWTAASLWLRYFNQTGIVLVVDPIEDYLAHFEDTLQQEPWASVLTGKLKVRTVKASLATKAHGKAKDRPVSFDAAQGGTILASDEVMRSCSESNAGPASDDPLHACARVLRRMAQPEPIEYAAPVLSFDDVWKRELGDKHIDFLRIDMGARSMGAMFEKSFSKVLQSRSVSVLAFRIDAFWSKADLKRVVEQLDKLEYFSMFSFVCGESSQVGRFSYYGPGGVQAGPTTYLPLSSMDIDSVVDWDKMPLPQDVLALDLRQPELFKTVQLGDVHCDVDEDEATGTCAAGDEQCKNKGLAVDGPPEQPELMRVTKSSSRSLTLEWKPPSAGPTPDSYLVRVDPGAQEETTDHDTFDTLKGMQMHTINGLRPEIEYTISIRSLGQGGESGKASLTHRTEQEEISASSSPYEVRESMHCGMGGPEEVQPAGPAPGGRSFFPGVGESEACRIRCDDNRDCVAYQVHIGDACWLYHRRPPPERISSPRVDTGWICAIRRPNA